MNESKSIEIRLAWLGGILDGEGTVCLGYVRSGSQSGKKISLLGRFEVAVGNTDEAMLNEVMAIADVLGIGYAYIHDRVRRRNDKPCNRVVFMGMKRVKAILEALMPYLITKRARAEMMLRAIQHRTSTMWRKGSRPGTWRGGGYTALAEDAQFAAYVRELVRMNRRGRIPDALTTEQTLPECSQRTTSAESSSVNVVGAVCEQEYPHPQGNRYTDERTVSTRKER